MKKEDLLTVMFRHHLWSNLTILDACKDLTEEQLDASAVGAYGSIIETLRHIARAERSYFSRISTGEMFQAPEDEPPMSFEEMKAVLQKTGEGLIEGAHKVQADDTVEVLWAGEPRQVPKTIIVTQVIEHGNEHREQIKTILTQLGIEPPDLQGWAYFDAMDQ
jgi:uncharacterized damage-inducible protein DinB